MLVLKEQARIFLIAQILSLLKEDSMSPHYNYGGNVTGAIFDVLYGFPSNQLAIIYDNYVDDNLLQTLTSSLFFHDSSVLLFNITEVDQQEQYFNYLQQLVDSYEGSFIVHLCNRKMLEFIIYELNERNFVRRNLIYMFYFGKQPMDDYLLDIISPTMKVIVVTNPRYDAYRLYFNQATSSLSNDLKLINWWINGAGLYQHPTLPTAEKIFRDFGGRMIDVPVLHKPPWHFVHSFNDSIKVLGGRDDKLLSLLAKKLNFQYSYFDPPEKSQGSSFNANGSFEGVLGLIWKREAEFFLGDVALTTDRIQAVEFSFFTLADSGAFVTHAPNKLNEAFSLVRPFQWEVWPAITFTLLISGPVLYVLIAAPNSWHPQFIVKSQSRLLFDCIWYTTRLFLKQTGKEPSTTHKVRFFIVIMYLSATYVISDMYSANLTSLLARPGREKAINNLRQLKKAVQVRGFKLFVEYRSSSYSLLENGTGIYGALWEAMNTKQESFLVKSVEEGVLMVKDQENMALIAGRETLYFDIQRFGAKSFHLSEKLNTAYSAIAMQIGCPYVENFNNILMAIFEAGILSKMTESEYEHQQQEPTIAEEESGKMKQEPRKASKAEKDNEKLEPINIKMLQGAFYLLFIGYFLSASSLGLELYWHTHRSTNRIKFNKKLRFLRKKKRKFLKQMQKRVDYVKRRIRNVFNDAILRTLDYVE